MIADEVKAAIEAIPCPNDAVSNSEYSVLLRAYDDAKRKVITEFRQRLASDSPASTRPASPNRFRIRFGANRGTLPVAVTFTSKSITSTTRNLLGSLAMPSRIRWMLG